LLEVLEDCDPASEVRIASGARWPMEYEIQEAVAVGGARGVVCPVCEYEEHSPDCTLYGDEVLEGQPQIVWIAEGQQKGYLPGMVAKTIGWR
jgi:hypothetical protein